MGSKRDVVSFPQPDAPKLTTTPLETINPNPNFEPSLASQYGYMAVGGLIGVLTNFLNNYQGKRPFLAGFHRYPLFAGIGVVTIYYLQKYKENQWAERDAVIRHYISLHPEDFPPYQRTKIGDLFEPWTPIR